MTSVTICQAHLVSAAAMNVRAWHEITLSGSWYWCLQARPFDTLPAHNNLKESLYKTVSVRTLSAISSPGLDLDCFSETFVPLFDGPLETYAQPGSLPRSAETHERGKKEPEDLAQANLSTRLRRLNRRPFSDRGLPVGTSLRAGSASLRL